MAIIESEGRINDNSYLIDTKFLGAEKDLAHYVVENDGMRLLIDAGITSKPAKKMVRKMKELGIFPVHKIVLTHSHWDHMQGVEQMKKLMEGTKIEVLASENAIPNLKNPKIMNDGFKNEILEIPEPAPIEDVIPLKEGDIIDLNGLKLEVLNFFGHTLDSIAIYDKSNLNIFVGDAIVNMRGNNFFIPPIMPPVFSEKELLKTYQKLRDLKEKDSYNSISLGHFGVYTENDFNKILDQMEDFYYNTKNSIIRWYNENPSVPYITSKYIDTFLSFLPNSELLKHMFQMPVGWIIKGLEMSGFIKN